ncbi:putative signal transducing protein [Vibrio aphrogenes]|uniref:putative signal transducing protein n=1 Tax=Vibrio aphrogenes TaxID=1891186 RepID=UPI000B358879|nr:DUF2007 domain-containing protein [Vibrio aphrogenes]
MKIFSASNPVEAHIVCELLKSHHINAKVHAEHTFSLKGELPLTQDSDPYVWLMDERDQQQARQLIAEYEQENNGPSWQCPSCQETIENQFAVCWNCGAVNPKQHSST